MLERTGRAAEAIRLRQQAADGALTSPQPDGPIELSAAETVETTVRVASGDEAARQ